MLSLHLLPCCSSIMVGQYKKHSLRLGCPLAMIQLSMMMIMTTCGACLTIAVTIAMTWMCLVHKHPLLLTISMRIGQCRVRATVLFPFDDPDAADSFDPSHFSDDTMKYVHPKAQYTGVLPNHLLAQIILFWILPWAGCPLFIFDKIVNLVQRYSRKTSEDLWLKHPFKSQQILSRSPPSTKWTVSSR